MIWGRVAKLERQVAILMQEREFPIRRDGELGYGIPGVLIWGEEEGTVSLRSIVRELVRRAGMKFRPPQPAGILPLEEKKDA